MKNNTGVPDPTANGMPGQKTGMPSVWGDLNLGSENQNQLSDQQAQRKKKVMSAGMSGAFQSLFGNRMSQTGSLGV
jgi:hypothetical protein